MKTKSFVLSVFSHFFQKIRKKFFRILLGKDLDLLNAELQKMEENYRKLILLLNNLQQKTDKELIPWLNNLQQKTDKELIPWLHELSRNSATLVEVSQKMERLYFDRYGSFEFNYLEFENVFRGDVEDIKRRFRMYLPYFDGVPGYILDIGCGRGEMLQLLTEHGFECKGVDSDRMMVEFCRHSFLNVDQSDAILYLENVPDESIGAIFLGQIVEHLGSRVFVRLMRICHQKLMKGGILLYETLNPESPDFLKYFYMDFSHVFPINPKSSEYFLKEMGWVDVRRVPTYFADVDYAMFARK